MTAYAHGKNAALLHGAVDLSPWVREGKATMTLEAADTSHFRSNAKTYITGQYDSSFTFSGMYDGTTGAIQPYMASVIATETTNGDPSPVILAPEDVALGRIALVGLAKQTSYEVSTVISDVETVSGGIQITGGLYGGFFLNDLESLATSTLLAGLDNTTSSANGAFVTLHVLENENTDTTTFTIQHSTDGDTWVDLHAFDSVDAGTTVAASAVLTGPINRYVRLKADLSGTGNVSVTATLSRY